MSLLAAAVPVAVLVLAWDEATPAVRALLEATAAPAPVLDSVVVLVPAETDEPAQKELLPAEPAPVLPAGPAETTATENALDATPLSALAPAALLPLAEPVAPALGAALATVAATVPLPAPEAPPLPAPTALAGGAVRLLRLSSFSLPELAALSHQALPQPTWVGSALLPAVPYLGSQPASPATATSAPADATSREEPTTLPLLASLPSAGAPLATTWLPGEPAPLTPTAYLPGEPLPALDAEADLAPVLFDDLAEEPAPIGTAQAGWTEALASLRSPLPPEEEPAPAPELENEAAYYAATTPEPAAAAEPAEQLPASQPFAAPDLNFQVIQYARFAVPVALTQAPFGAIYAPAWPTWLAAQELRYRTRQPLVLHVTTLAAGEEESVVTATGWQAELQRQALQRADLILAETPALTHRLRRDLGLPPELVRTVLAADATAVALALRTAQLRPTVNPS